ncbi:polyprenyl synthetase family protein [Mucisphaera calidilacus]|uniref:Octaprenyl-diphosphate synthase n=1 Tax=Mucisphaera calidilacus TaxID=2527982 RepID=A0A518BXT3_9BACT|nr:polyprenyl synthetase family protein [Mucisphaera calidilacus]QDU71781.1 Octaprenyl-diphosphate synthase [Mucisphaera calidilacus]
MISTHDSALQSWLDEELEGVVSRFEAELSSELSCVNWLSSYVQRYRGKMLRPSLLLLAGYATSEGGDRVSEAHRVASTVVEMIHMATLVHDDILDEADLRRRGATINHLRGNEAAVMLGDYLISHAYHLCSSLEGTWISRAVGRVTNTVCEGELLQLENRENWSLDRRTYLEIVRRKTGGLCGLCCWLGGALWRGTPAVPGRDDSGVMGGLWRFGESLGVAFQVADDVLDLVGEEREVGKTLGVDLRKGKLTLPVIVYLSMLEEAERGSLIETFSALGEMPENEFEDVLRSLRGQIVASGALDAARDEARGLLAVGVEEGLGGLSEGPAVRALAGLSEQVVDRWV